MCFKMYNIQRIVYMKKRYNLARCNFVAIKMAEKDKIVQYTWKTAGNRTISGCFLVEVTGFEPATFWSRILIL